ncbi:MAG TPA: hypothetical protein VGY53_13580 [Isosphaeraceae bacterium]|nr:hypothetical protein [Isosphaeraceae bacterium]
MPVLRWFRIRLRTFALAIAALALVLAFLVPLAKQVLFPSQWNTWIVKTARQPDGSAVRLRIRRYPQRDVIHKEVLPASGTGEDRRLRGAAQIE